jgi:hypothetical protein
MKINLFLRNSSEPICVEVDGANTVAEALTLVADPELLEVLLDSSGIRRHVSAYLGIPREGVRNIKSEQGMETAIKQGEELTFLIADPFTN